jgi:tRNA(fMet)-specific endonuclease VapC
MSWLLHRDTCAAVIRGVRRVSAHFAQQLGQIHVSALTITVLELWLTRVKTPTRYLQGYAAIFQNLKVVPVDDVIAHRAARLGNAQSGQGPSMTLVDLIVAATAVSQGFTLVTRDTGLFANVPGLMLADWFVP